MEILLNADSLNYLPQHLHHRPTADRLTGRRPIQSPEAHHQRLRRVAWLLVFVTCASHPAKTIRHPAFFQYRIMNHYHKGIGFLAKYHPCLVEKAMCLESLLTLGL